MPTKTFPTLLAIAWLKKLVLPEIDRLELDLLLADLEHMERRVDRRRARRADADWRLATASG